MRKFLLFLLLLLPLPALAAPAPERVEAVKAMFFNAGGFFPQIGGATYARVQFLSGSNWATVSSADPLPVSCISGCASPVGTSDVNIKEVGGNPVTTTVPVSGTVTATQATGSNLHIVCDSGCGGAASFKDNDAFTAGTTPINITGGWYSTSPTNCTDGSACSPQLSQDRKLFVNAFQGTSPWVVSNGGTFAVQAAQSGTWTVQPGNTANTTAWLVTGTGGTFPATQSGNWSTRTQDGSGNAITSTASALDINIKSGSIANTSFGATQGTSPWIVAGGGTAGVPGTAVLTIQGIGSGTAVPVSLASAPTTAVTIADGADVTLGAKADAKSTATDTTPVTVMQVLKEISAMEQAPASRAVTNAGTFATQSAITAASGSIASGAIASGAIASGAVASGAFASGSIASGACASGCVADGGITTLGAKTDAKSTATDATSTSVVSILKEISAMAQAPAALPANQSTNVAQINAHTALEAGVNGSLAVGGCVATNTATPCNPMNLGAQAVSSENSAATTSREVQLVADLVGKLIVLPYANPENFVNGTTAAITDTTSTQIIASAGGSLRNYITSVIVTNSHATVGTFVKILDGSTILWEGYAAAVGGGFTTSFPVPLRGTAATAVNCQPVTTGANVICSAQGYKGL
jgi:hypothetical protein